MAEQSRPSAERVADAEGRRRAMRVLDEVYRQEKGWIRDAKEMFPASDLGDQDVSWFLASVRGRPVGVTRVLYRLPMELYEDYQFDLVDRSLDVARFLATHRIAEIGRFAVVRRYRRRIRVAASLMRAATTETVERGFTHYITDVFENEPSSPYRFHQGVLGFRTVATHEAGELGFKGRRITMLLDLRDAYRRMQHGKAWIFRYIVEGWSDQLIQKLTGSAEAPATVPSPAPNPQRS